MKDIFDSKKSQFNLKTRTGFVYLVQQRSEICELCFFYRIQQIFKPTWTPALDGHLLNEILFQNSIEDIRA